MSAHDGYSAGEPSNDRMHSPNPEQPFGDPPLTRWHGARTPIDLRSECVTREEYERREARP